MNLRPLGLEKTGIIAKLAQGQGAQQAHVWTSHDTFVCKRTRFWKVCVATSLEGVPLSSMQFKVCRAHLWRKYGPLTLTNQIVLGKPRTNCIVPFASIWAPPIYTGTKVLFSRARKKLSPTWGIVEELQIGQICGPSKTEEILTTVNYVQSKYKEIFQVSADVSNGHCWDSWQCA